MDAHADSFRSLHDWREPAVWFLYVERTACDDSAKADVLPAYMGLYECGIGLWSDDGIVACCPNETEPKRQPTTAYANRRSHKTSSTCWVARSTCPARCAMPSRRHNAGRSGRMTTRLSGNGVVASWGKSAAP